MNNITYLKGNYIIIMFSGDIELNPGLVFCTSVQKNCPIIKDVIKCKIHELQTTTENSSKRIAELSTEVAKTNEGKQKLQSELSETAKRCANFQKRCVSYFNQVVSLNSKQQEYEEEISSLKRSCENLRAQVAEKEAMMIMMRDSASLF